MVILMALIIGTAMTSYGSRIQAVQTKSQTEAMLAAEAGYEQAIFWMSQRTDLLGDIQAGRGQGTINFETGSCSYIIAFHGFIGARPVFRITSTGVCGRPSFTRVVDVDVVQETSGWAMGTCRIPSGTNSTDAVYFGSNEIMDMPLHINKYNDSPDVRDIWIQDGDTPRFLRKVEMGESRKTTSGTDKYSAVMPRFEAGIDFDQPNIRITDQDAVTSKITRFYNSTDAAYRFTPAGPNSLVGTSTTRCSAVQLEFFVDVNGVGKVRITNNCTVKLSSPSSTDYNVVSGGSTFSTYNIYAYHYRPTGGTQLTISINDDSSPCYVSQTIGTYTSAKGGQIFVNGNVVIGGGEDTNFTDINNMVVKGKITVVAAGNIWIADSIRVAGPNETTRDPNGMPTEDNPNVLGLIAQGVIKVVDPGLLTSNPSIPGSGLTYQPIGIKKSASDPCYVRYLPDPTVVEAAITVGGGGWGAENVGAGNRRVYSTPQDFLVVHGSITEVIRGVVGHLGSDGYIKKYYIDTRLMSGILPGDIWFSGKYIPAPAGWHDHSPN
jgi:hypothetical protein